MYKLGVFLAVLGAVTADVGLGYHYKVPHTSYGVPSYQLGGSHSYYKPTFSSSSASTASSGPYKVQAAPGGHLGSNYAQSTTGYQTFSGALPSNSFSSGFGHGSSNTLVNGLSSGSYTGLSQGSSTIGSSGSESSINSGFNHGSGSSVSSGLNTGTNSGFSQSSGSSVSSGQNTGTNSGFSYGSGSSLGSGLGSSYYPESNVASVSQPTYQVSSTPAPGFFSQYHASNQYLAHQNYQQYYEIKEQPAQVFKHFYVHSVPEEPEPIRPRVPIVLPAPQKHYKIIFVKAPGQVRTSQIVQVPQPQNEEKTIVYVLVKKPEDRQEVIIPKVEQKAPSKPEVYYIKYNNKQDSQAVIENIVSDYNKGQPLSLSNVAGSEGFYDASTLLNHPSTSEFSSSSLSSSSALTPSSTSTFVTGAQPISTGFLSTPVSSSGYLNSPSTFGSTGYLNSIPPVTGSNIHDSTFNKFGVLSDAATESQGSSSGSYETQSYGVSSGSSSANPSLSVSTIDNDEGSSGSISSTLIPVISSSTPVYDQLNTISTSQGIPHETYGSPKFREE